MSIADKRRYAAAAFLTLLLLSVFWPSPVVSINLLWVNTDLDVDHLSFLGREAPSWDVVFWCVAGLFLLIIVQSAERDADWRDALAVLRSAHRPNFRPLLGLVAGVILTTLFWLFFDRPVLAWAEYIQSDFTRDIIRILNRLGGGMNPVMLVAFLFIAGICYRERRWIAYAIAMSIAGLAAGVFAQVIKHLVGRARPELWLGPMHYAPGSSTSFPSGHTVGAFALAGVLIFGSRSLGVRLLAFALAAGVGLSRVLAFRHWLSDVTASAVIGLVTAWIVTQAVTSNDARDV
jgi:membrane-associated phospholipid phosphatase